MSRSKTCPDFVVSFSSDALAVREALAHVLQHLACLELNEDDTAAFELVAAEVLNNIVEHAYAGRADGVIRLWCIQRPDGLHLRFEDEGVEMSGGSLPCSEAADPDVEFYDLPEGGFGWFMIHVLSKDLTYRREGRRNLLTLHFPLNASMYDKEE